MFLISSSYLASKKEKAYDSIAFEIYDRNTLDRLDNVTEEDDSPSSSDDNKGNNSKPSNGGTSKPSNNSSGRNSYIGTLEIPKIKVKKGFVDPSSKYNDINYNVTDLYKLDVGDKAYVSYKGVKYTYKIVKIYKQKKQGYVTIYRDPDKTTLALITCTKGNKKSQTVYIAERI